MTVLPILQSFLESWTRDPLYWLHFITTFYHCVGYLYKLIVRARDPQLFRGLLVEKGENIVKVTYLLFVDDTLLFYCTFIQYCVLLYFQVVLGCKTNMANSKLVPIGDGSDFWLL